MTAHPVFENEAEDSSRHLKKQQDGQKDGIGRQQSGVLTEGSDAAGEADDEGDGSREDEDESWIERDVGEQREVVERVFLGPGPHADRQNAQAQ